MRVPGVGLLVVTAALLAAQGGLAQKAAARPQEVFVLAGQSNMSGRGLPLTLSSPSDRRLLVWTQGGWQVAQDPLPRASARSGIGPAMTFGLQLARHQPGVTVGLVMCAVGASSIADWQPGHGSLYDQCLAQVRAAGGSVAGVLFLQGEAEAKSAVGAATWLSGFRSMLAALRTDLPGRWPLLLGQIGTLRQGKYPAQQEVRDAQALAAGSDPRIRLVRTLDLPNDGTHFTVPAYRVIGARFATAWWRYAPMCPSTTEDPVVWRACGRSMRSLAAAGREREVARRFARG